MLFRAPRLDGTDLAVVAEIDGMREELRHVLRRPTRWEGQLRRTLTALAIQGSNSIEGYLVSRDDAEAAVDGDAPATADEATWREITGYRTALSYVQQLADDRTFAYSDGLLKGLHFMMLSHQLSVRPGLYREREIFVHDSRTGRNVYEGPEAGLVPGLVDELLAGLSSVDDQPVFVRAAMAHLNLVMIHPFRDGNGRMARCLQTLVLARDGILAPEFSSIEEHLGANTPDYYAVLAATGGGAWHPERDTARWVRFSLRAHHLQAQTVRRRLQEASGIYRRLDTLVSRAGLPDRMSAALYDAARGLVVTRGRYGRAADVKPGTAGGDLRLLVAAGLLTPRGETKGRTYRATPALTDLRNEVRAELPMTYDPYERQDRGPVPGQGTLL